MNKNYLFLALAVAILTACAKDNYNGLTGKIIGTATLYDSRTYDKTKISVQLEGHDPALSTHLDSNGYFTFENIKTGTYRVLIQGDSLCTNKTNPFLILGGSEPVAIHRNLCLLPFGEIESTELNTYKGFDQSEAYLRVLFKDDSYQYSYYRYYVSTSSDVSYNNYLMSGIGYNRASIKLELDLSAFPLASTYYVKCYPSASLYSNNFYYDMTTGLAIYTNINIEHVGETISSTIPEN